jgi:hypothetical protein
MKIFDALNRLRRRNSEVEVNTGVSIQQFIRAIERLPSDPPADYPGKWYKTQKEHWLGWLREYHGPGAYGRQTGKKRDARYAYNHIVEPLMLLWLIEAAGVDPDTVAAAKQATEGLATKQQKSAAVRRLVPWEMLAQALWK